MSPNSLKFWPAFTSRSDLQSYGSSALLLFALQMKFNIEDIATVASTSLTEGAGDKKADLIYIDSESGNAVIAQSYFSQKTLDKNGKPIKEAPANKASDLNTAVSWLLCAPIEDLPSELRAHAAELRQAINEKTIARLHIWYVHNLPESKNVDKEISVVGVTAKSIIEAIFEDTDIDILPLEVGINVLEGWYQFGLTPILVSDEFKIETIGGFPISGPDWTAYVTSIPAKWLYEQFKLYKTDLFSADIREYLGSRKSDTNINFAIKTTAEKDPGHFWVYNNGITALVHEFQPIKIDDKPGIQIKGFSIVNGAKTTGVIGALSAPPDDNAYVQVRFIKCTNVNRVHDIVLFNNSQNRVSGPDFRSNDPIQRRLLTEFEIIPNIDYVPRRGGFEDVIKRRPDSLLSITAGQALAAFHNDPDVAYHQKTKLWDDDKLYSKYFHEHTTAKHILFSYSLLKAVENKKIDLINKSKNGTLIELEQNQLNFFRKRGSIFLMVAAIAKCMEILVARPIPNPFNLSFKFNLSPDEAASKWTKIIETTAPFVNQLEDGVSDGFRNRPMVDISIQKFQSMVASSKAANSEPYDRFAVDISF